MGSGRPRRPWRAFRLWRYRRPFGAGLTLALGGVEILVTQRASITVILTAGADSLVGYVLPVIMVICGLLVVLNPRQRLFYSVVGVLASLGSWVTSNLGGFVIGMLLGLVGSSLAFGWLPDRPRRRPWRRSRRREPEATGSGTAATAGAAAGPAPEPRPGT
ncbi:DUF6114 domain-containing protein [Streptomyces gardneri]|uniref:Integral membrane protein n=1 Tax=Streptomyces gardneri TaxID=66892 RepID=A0A4Y3RNA8_9ACTN|nr:DUF6114 domain-containing protein [Streptomyces gardneri]GEB58233.1 hypothetical protein SGA01_38380 [Streptomyces gardneri]GHH17297.1 hypothetical protein GCM10017674_68080 [Streptomyces gardneri]